MIVAELAAKLGLVPDEHSWEHGHELVESLHHALEAYIGVEAIAKAGEMVEGFVETAVSAKHLSERLGVTTESIQELEYAASLSGSSAEGMQVSMQHLARGLNELTTKGSGPVAEAFQQLHISIKDIKGESLDQNLEVIANKFAGMEDGPKKTALAMQLFGRSGTELIPLLNRGQAGIVELREEAEKLGVVIGDEGVEKAEEFERAQKKLKASVTGLKNEAIEALLPSIEKLVDRMSEWVSENREAIASTLQAVVEGLTTAIGYAADAVGALIDFWEEHHDVAIAVIEAIGVVLAAFAVEAAIDWVIAFAPLAAAIAVITAVILLIQHWDEVMDEMKDVAGGAWDFVKDKAQGFADWFEGLPDDVAEWVDSIAESIMNAFRRAWQFVVDGAHQAWEDIKDLPIIGRLASGIESVVDYVGGTSEGRSTIAEAYTTGDYSSVPGMSGSFVTPSAGGGVDNSVRTVSFGDTHVHVNNSTEGLDEDDVGEMIGQAVREHHDDMVREAYDGLSGGKK